MIDSLKRRIATGMEDACATLFKLIDSQKNSEIKNSQLYACMQEIEDAHSYPLHGHGKLIRPLLVLLTAGSFGGESAVENAISSAVAVELVHTYSLVHDDLPCMDNDAMRRGRPSTHVVYGEAKGLLVGDGLLTAAFELLARQNFYSNSTLDSNHEKNAYWHLKRIQSLSQAIGPRGMVFGQWLDMAVSDCSQMNESQTNDWEIFCAIHSNKTGKLFGACFEMGYLCAQQSNVRELLEGNAEKNKLNNQNIQNTLVQIGLDFGFAFQILDDILDATRSSAELGKTSGKDLEQNKMTAVKILGLDGARNYAQKCFINASQKLEQLFYETQNSTDATHPNSNEYFKNLLNLVDYTSCRSTC